MGKVLIAIPAYNEEQNIVKTVKDVIENTDYDYVVINDCSQDNTKNICEENNFKIISLPVNLGLTGVFRLGIKYALKNNYDIMVQFDGDGQHQAKYLNEMINKLEKDDLDIVIGSRFLTEKKGYSPRMLGSRLLSTLIKIITSKSIKDPTAGLRAYNKKAMLEFYNDFNLRPEPDTIVYMLKKGLKVGEVQVQMKEREYGESYLNLENSIIYMVANIMAMIIYGVGIRKK